MITHDTHDIAPAQDSRADECALCSAPWEVQYDNANYCHACRDTVTDAQRAAAENRNA
jgi:hypothetical protein